MTTLEDLSFGTSGDPDETPQSITQTPDLSTDNLADGTPVSEDLSTTRTSSTDALDTLLQNRPTYVEKTLTPEQASRKKKLMVIGLIGATALVTAAVVGIFGARDQSTKNSQDPSLQQTSLVNVDTTETGNSYNGGPATARGAGPAPSITITTN